MPASILHWYNLLSRWVIASLVLALILIATHVVQTAVVWILNRRSGRWPRWRACRSPSPADPIDDAVSVEGEFGFVEEITSTYIVIRLWDLRRMILPLT